MREITLRELLEAGCHFGHQTTRWHPKAASYIYGSKDGVHIIDLAKTKEGLEEAAKVLTELAKSGGSVLFVGTKRQGQPIIEEIAKKIRETKDNNFFYLLERWPGGLLTNFEVIKKNNLETILKLQDDIANNRFVTKKEKLLAQRKLDKYIKLYGGLVGLTKLPDAIFFLDIRKEAGAVKEAVRAEVKVIAITDTNVDPTPVNLAIPANDDAVGSIKVITEYLGDAWLEGLNLKEKTQENVEEKTEKKTEEKK